jgi:hypothetical protein
MSERDPVLEHLLGLGPDPGDQAMASFAEMDLPEGLAADTLARVQAERESAPVAANTPRGWLKFVVTGLGVAAAALLVVQGSPETGDVSSMTARGLEETTPTVALKMAAERNGALERFRDDQAYGPGDVLFFRYQVDGEGWVNLVHASPQGLVVLTQEPVQIGEADLTHAGQQIQWRIEDGDPDAVFALITSNEPIQADDLQAQLAAGLTSGQTVDPRDLCAAAEQTGRRCDAVRVTTREDSP